MVFVEDGKVAATGTAASFFGDAGPAAFRRYVGPEESAAEMPRIARKPT
jgi:thiamine transport system ATP-binding protein